jgi:flagellar motor protein MotB
MKLVGIFSTAVLSLTLGAIAPAYAQQEQQKQQEEQKAKPAQNEKKAQPEKSAKPEERPAAQQEKNNKQEEKNAQQQGKNAREEKTAQQQHTQEAKPAVQAQHSNANHGGRIPDERFKANFGREHSFRVSQGDYRDRHFQYGGYSFGFVDPWPSNWLYTQDVYVVEIDGVYYLCNPMYPGVNLVLSFTL